MKILYGIRDNDKLLFVSENKERTVFVKIILERVIQKTFCVEIFCCLNNKLTKLGDAEIKDNKNVNNMVGIMGETIINTFYSDIKEYLNEVYDKIQEEELIDIRQLVLV